MAAGDLTASTPTIATTTAGIKTAVDALNLAATTDQLFVLKIGGVDQAWAIFKVERAAA